MTATHTAALLLVEPGVFGYAVPLTLMVWAAPVLFAVIRNALKVSYAFDNLMTREHVFHWWWWTAGMRLTFARGSDNRAQQPDLIVGPMAGAD